MARRLAMAAVVGLSSPTVESHVPHWDHSITHNSLQQHHTADVGCADHQLLSTTVVAPVRSCFTTPHWVSHSIAARHCAWGGGAAPFQAADNHSVTMSRHKP